MADKQSKPRTVTNYDIQVIEANQARIEKGVNTLLNAQGLPQTGKNEV